MKISIKYLETAAAGAGVTARRRAIVLGDDANDLPIRKISGPEVGITVETVAKARAEAVTNLDRRNRKYAGEFTVGRRFASYWEQIQFRHLHAQDVCRAATLIIEEAGQSIQAEAIIHSLKPGNVTGVGCDFTYYFISGDFE